MTRFARAKGSKSSNERKPEEPTSWSEMKKSMLSKKNEAPGDYDSKEMKTSESQHKWTQWATLADESFSDSMSILKEHITRGNKKGNKLGMEGEKKKKVICMEEEQINAFINGKSKKKEKGTLKTFVTNESEGNVREKVKKRKKIEVEESFKKRKKFSEISNEKVEKEEEVISKFQKKESKLIGLKRRNVDFGEKRQFQKKFNSNCHNKSFTKASSSVEELIINGEKIEIVKFQGFCVTLGDAERLRKLQLEMKKEGIPKAKLEAAIKLERRRAEKALSRLKKNVCFHCRNRGHLLSHCPDLQGKETTGTGICYKCGSTEHSVGECKVVRGSQFQFAECFICREQGHIARQCPDNPRGLYPQGGSCRQCGDVTHLRKDCPQVLSQKEEEAVTVGLRSERDLECLDEEILNVEKEKNSKKNIRGKNSIIKF